MRPATPLLSATASAIIFIFAWLVLRRYTQRRSRHLLIWGIGLILFGTASLAEAYSAVAWHPLVFRLWYLGGAMLCAAWIGQGTVWLLAGAEPPSAFRRLLLRRWPAQRVAMLLTWLLTAASLAAAFAVFAAPLDASAFDAARPLSAQYREILPRGAPVRRLTPVFNLYGTLTLSGGALYSAWLLRRREIMAHRVLGNVLIALGALAIASAGAVVRLGLGDYLSLGELLAAALMFSGFLLAAGRAPDPSAAQGAQA